MVEGPGRSHGRAAIAIRLRVGVAVEGRVRDSLAARPETGARPRVGVSVASDPVRQVRDTARVLWGEPPGEPRHRRIERAPEEVYRAALALEPCSEISEDAVRLNQHHPESLND